MHFLRKSSSASEVINHQLLQARTQWISNGDSPQLSWYKGCVHELSKSYKNKELLQASFKKQGSGMHAWAFKGITNKALSQAPKKMFRGACMSFQSHTTTRNCCTPPLKNKAQGCHTRAFKDLLKTSSRDAMQKLSKTWNIRNCCRPPVKHKLQGCHAEALKDMKT